MLVWYDVCHTQIWQDKHYWHTL